MKNRKLVALCLVVVMLLAVLAGCSNNNSDTNDSSNSTSTSNTNSTNSSSSTNTTNTETNNTGETEEKDPLDILSTDTSISGTVRFWMPFTEENGMGALIEEFNEMYPNITVELTTFSNTADGNLSVNTAIMAGEVDVLGSFGLQYAQLRWDNGLYIDLTDRVEEEGIDLVANWGTDIYTYNDRIYTFPAGGLSYYIAINMDAWEEAGLGEIPTEWTWDEYIAASKAMTKYDDAGNVLVYGGSDHSSIETALLGKSQVYGDDFLYDNSTGYSSFGMDEVKTILDQKYNAELVDKVWLPLATYRADSLKAQDVFLTGQVASVVTENLQRYVLNDSYDYDFKIAFAPYPVMEEGQTNYMSGVRYFSHYGICTGCQDEEAAWVFLKWMTTVGSKYLGAAGHISEWQGTDASALVDVCFGSEEAAAEKIDVDSFKNVVGVVSNPKVTETNFTAVSEVTSIAKKYILSAMNGEITVDEAIAKAQQECDAAIDDAK